MSYLVYCKRRHGRRTGYIELLGPIVETQEEAQEEMEKRNKEGWDASWVELNSEAVWIVV